MRQNTWCLSMVLVPSPHHLDEDKDAAEEHDGRIPVQLVGHVVNAEEDRHGERHDGCPLRLQAQRNDDGQQQQDAQPGPTAVEQLIKRRPNLAHFRSSNTFRNFLSVTVLTTKTTRILLLIVSFSPSSWRKPYPGAA